MFKLDKDYQGANFKLKAGQYSKEQLVKIVGSEGVLHYIMTCTDLKNYIYKTTEETPVVEQEAAVEHTAEEVVEETPIVEQENQDGDDFEIIYLVEKDIKKGKKILFKQGQKLAYEDLKEFDIQALLDKDFLLETKIAK